MKAENKKILTVSLVVLLLTLASLSMASSTEVEPLEGEKELVLLRSEHYLYVDASETVTEFHIRYSFPPDYGYQTPIIMEILEDSNASIINYKIEDEVNEPNKVVNFTIGQMEQDERRLIHFNYWVLVENHDYSDLPAEVKIPKEDELPMETKKWLQPSEVVQSNKLLIKLRAKMLKGFKNDQLILADRIANFCQKHREVLFNINYLFQKIIGYGPQDAFSTLIRNGECPGRSHLGCALFRANGVPARVLLVSRSYNFWFEMHYMTEYYLQDYGWILTEVHGATTPEEPKNQIILRICHPEDENNTITDFMYPRMKGLEPWLWIDNEDVCPYYVDCIEGSKIRAFTESEVIIDSVTTNEMLLLTQTVFYQYENYLGMNLIGENLEHFQNATGYQKEAINKLIDLGEPYCYLYFMDKAYDEYNEIEI